MNIYIYNFEAIPFSSRDTQLPGRCTPCPCELRIKANTLAQRARQSSPGSPDR